MTFDSTLSLFFWLFLLVSAYFYLTSQPNQRAQTDDMVRVQFRERDTVLALAADEKVAKQGRANDRRIARYHRCYVSCSPPVAAAIFLARPSESGDRTALDSRADLTRDREPASAGSSS